MNEKQWAITEVYARIRIKNHKYRLVNKHNPVSKIASNIFTSNFVVANICGTMLIRNDTQ